MMFSKSLFSALAILALSALSAVQLASADESNVIRSTNVVGFDEIEIDEVDRILMEGGNETDGNATSSDDEEELSDVTTMEEGSSDDTTMESGSAPLLHQITFAVSAIAAAMASI